MKLAKRRKNMRQLFAQAKPAFNDLASDVVPDAPAQLMAYVEQVGLKEEGIFRIPGNSDTMDKTIRMYAKRKDVDLEQLDPHTAAGVLKKWLRDMPNPLFTHELYDAWLSAVRIDEVSGRIRAVRACVKLLPVAHKSLLKTLMEFLCKVCQYSEVNKMTTANIAIVFAPTLLQKEDGGIDPLKALEEQGTAADLVAFIIENYEYVFGHKIFTEDTLEEEAELQKKTEEETPKRRQRANTGGSLRNTLKRQQTVKEATFLQHLHSGAFNMVRSLSTMQQKKSMSQVARQDTISLAQAVAANQIIKKTHGPKPTEETADRLVYAALKSSKERQSKILEQTRSSREVIRRKMLQDCRWDDILQLGGSRSRSNAVENLKALHLSHSASYLQTCHRELMKPDASVPSEEPVAPTVIVSTADVDVHTSVDATVDATVVSDDASADATVDAAVDATVDVDRQPESNDIQEPQAEVDPVQHMENLRVAVNNGEIDMGELIDCAMAGSIAHLQQFMGTLDFEDCLMFDRALQEYEQKMWADQHQELLAIEEQQESFNPVEESKAPILGAAENDDSVDAHPPLEWQWQ